MTDSPSPSSLPLNHTHAKANANADTNANASASVNENTSANANVNNSASASAKASVHSIADSGGDFIANPIDRLIRRLARLPGLGPRSARRVVLHLMSNKENVMLPLVEDMAEIADTIRLCATCGNWDTSEVCRICRDGKRDASVLCVVENVADLWAMERASVFGGYYHVLGGVLSAIDGVGPDALRIDQLIARLTTDDGGVVKEVILALSATVDGQATAHYIADCIAHLSVKRTRLAHGVPVGGELDYLDDGTLAHAMKARALI